MTKVLHAGRFLELVEHGRWEFVRRRVATAVVGLVAVTPSDELLLVEQQRLPVAAPVIELPAGLVGDEVAHEGLLDAAARELEEETGWRGARLRVLARGPSSAGLTSEIVTLIRAEGLTRVGDGGGVAGERIVVHQVPLATAASWLQNRADRGRLIDHKVYAGLWWLDRERSEQRP
jgi:ADP-ribose pyrophosphatase